MRVGSFAPNAWGLYDMHRNMLEYCWNLFDYIYPSSAQTDPTGPINKGPANLGLFRVGRGGSWYDHVYQCRSAYRIQLDPQCTEWRSWYGFRVVRP